MISAGKYRVSWLLAAVLFAGSAACNKTQPNVAQDQSVAGNPADGGLAPVSQVTTGQTTTQNAQPAPAPNYAPAPESTSYPQASYDTSSNEQAVYAPEPPPPLPQYQQPPCPGDDYIWTPGYWDYSDAGYYWVPGAWVIAPYVGALWTPPWWGFYDGRYMFHQGYWGSHIGFYGGIDYGFGYTGHGYWGGYWNHGHLWYNRDATNVNTSVVHNLYKYQPPRYNNTRVSYNGGRGGVEVRALPAEQTAAREAHAAPVPAQVQHARQAATNRAQFAAENRGKPQIATAERPLSTAYHAPAARPPAEAARPPAETARPAAAARAPETRAQLQPEPNRGPENRPAPPQQVQRRENRPAPEARPNPLARTAPQPEARPAPVTRTAPQSRPETRPTQAARPAPEARPIPQARPTPAVRATPEARPTPAARPAARPAPEARPTPAARPAPERRPTPAPAEPGRGDARKPER